MRNIKLTQKGKHLFPDYSLADCNMGFWEIALSNNHGYRILLAAGANDVKALIDMGIIEFSEPEIDF